jgi:hypothetical protein
MTTITTTKKMLYTLVGVLLVSSMFGACKGKKKEAEEAPVSMEVTEEGEISDEVLKRFIEIDDMLKPIQQDAEGKMIDIISAKGMTLERYLEIGNTAPAEQEKIDKKDMDIFDAINLELEAIENAMMDDYHKKIEEMGFKIEDFRRLVNRVYQDPVLQSRLNELNKPEETIAP